MEKMRIVLGISLFAVVLLAILYSCTDDKWSEKTRKEFIEECMKNDLTEDACHCILKKIEEKDFKPSSLNSDDEEVKKAYEEAIEGCLGLY